MAAGMVCTAKWSSSSYPTSASMEGNSAASIVSEDNVSVVGLETALHQSREIRRGLIQDALFVSFAGVYADCMHQYAPPIH